MKKYLEFILIILLTLIHVETFAETVHYRIFVDGGSSGSRLHLYKYTEVKANSLPIIEDIFSESAKPGLSSYVDNPDKAGESVKKLLDDAHHFMQQQKINTTTQVIIYGTAGMRLLPEDKQQAIYLSLFKFIGNSYNPYFHVTEAKTISGKDEGYYDWLSVNYMLRNFQTGAPTVGAIDMGGASTQISFATTDQSKPNDEFNIVIAGKKYIVFSKSFLGLGQDEVRHLMTEDEAAGFCFPRDYIFKEGSIGNFNMVGCSNIYNAIIAKRKVSQEIIPTHQTFVAFSGIYYIYDFFHADKAPDQSSFEMQLQSICNEKSWQQLIIDYPNIAEKYLANYCANGVYSDQLIYNAYKINGSELIVTNQINQKDIDWTLGAIINKFIQA